MTLQVLLNNIAARYNSAATEAETIVFINEAIEKVWRYIAKDSTTEVETTEDVAIYSFPSGVKPEAINAVTISVTEEDATNETIWEQRNLNPMGLNDPYQPNSWAKVDELTFIVTPVPTEDGQVIRIYYQMEPPTYVIGDVAEDLEDYIRKDYIQAIQFDALASLFETYGDIQSSNNYTIRFNAELGRLRAEKWSKSGKFPRTKDVMKRRSRNRRYAVKNNVYYGDTE